MPGKINILAPFWAAGSAHSCPTGLPDLGPRWVPGRPACRRRLWHRWRQPGPADRPCPTCHQYPACPELLGHHWAQRDRPDPVDLRPGKLVQVSLIDAWKIFIERQLYSSSNDLMHPWGVWGVRPPPES